MNGFLRRYGLFFLLCLTGFATFFCSYLRIPVLPLYAASLGAGPAQVGMINGAFMLTAGIFSIPGGLLADRLGRRRPAVCGILAIAASSFLITQCATPGQMAAAYLLFGAGLAAFVPSMLSQIADSLPQERLGQAYGWYSTATYVAMTLGPAAGGYLGKSFGLPQVFYLSAALLLLPALAAGAILPSSPTSRKTDPHDLVSASVSLLHNRTLLACLAATLGASICFGAFLSFMPLYAKGKGLDPAQVGLVFAAQALTNVVSRIPVGFVADRTDRRGLVSAGLLCLAVGLSALGGFDSPSALAACAVVLGMGMALSFTAIGALVAEAVSPFRRGLAMGMFNSCVYLGMMGGSLSLGSLIRTIGYPSGFAVGGAVAVVTVLLFFRLMRNRSREQASGGNFQ
jgi:MFS family permease